MGDVTNSASFSVDAGAGGSWVGVTYVSETDGTWTVTGTYSGESDTASLTVEAPPEPTFAETHVPLQTIMDAVEVDGQWVQFNLVAPYEPFMQILAGSWGSIMSKDWAIANGDWDGTQASYELLNDPPPNASPLHEIANGTGPFSLERWDPAIETVLLRNDNYWRAPANFERLVIKVVPEWTTRKLMLLAAEADIVDVPRAYIGELEGVAGIRAYQDLPALQVDAIFFQFEISPESTYLGSGQLDGAGITLDFFNDLDVRLGFTKVFDWDVFINDALLGEGVQAQSPIVEGLSYYNPAWLKHSQNYAEAEAHFKAAWGGTLWDTGFTFTATYNEGNVTRQTAMEVLAANLLAINPKFVMNVQAVPWPTFLDGMILKTLPLFCIGWLPDYPDAHNFIQPFMHSDGLFSGWQTYNNPVVDAHVVAGIAATDPAERQAHYDALSQLYYEDAPGILLAQPLGRRFFRDYVTGFYFNPTLPSTLGNIYQLNRMVWAPGDNFVYATIGGVDTMDPAYAYDTASGEVLQNVIYETLIAFDGESTTEFVPVLATEWTVSDDGMTYRFKIREGVTFHEGQTLTPADVEYSIERGMVQDYGGGPQWMIYEPLLGLHGSWDVD
jgi:peptide/nickel transport system substrate-binding protein